MRKKTEFLDSKQWTVNGNHSGVNTSYLITVLPVLSLEIRWSHRACIYILWAFAPTAMAESHLYASASLV